MNRMPLDLAAIDQVEFFRNRVAVVTGAGRGIGRAVAVELARLGAIVHVVSVTDNANTTTKVIRAAGGRAVAHVGSVDDDAFCRNLLAELEESGSGPDILVNAAAVLGKGGCFSQTDINTFEKIISVNLLGTARMMRVTLPGMESRGFGRIINFAGGGAAYAYPNFSAYGTSKAAVVRLTETVAKEIKTADVTINVIAPGAVATDMLAQVRQQGGDVRTVVAMDEPVRLVCFLAGPLARNITGRFIHARDRYTEETIYRSEDNLTLRRIEGR